MAARVLELMQIDPPCASVPGSRQELLRLFSKHRLSALPVVKEGSRKLAGVVHRADLFRSPEETQTALLMNPNPFTMYAQATIREAANVVVENRLSILPVVSGANDLLGLLTPTHFLHALATHKGRVQNYVQRRVVPVHVSTPAVVAMKILSLTNTPALPVLDDQGKLCGIVTDGDLLSRSHVAGGSRGSVVGISSDEDEWTWEGLRDVRRLQHATSKLQVPSMPVEGVMVRHVHSARTMTTVGEAARTMLDQNVNQLPVVNDEGELVDLLTDLDLLAALL